MNENQLTFVREYVPIKPLIHKIDSLSDNCFRDCNNEQYLTFDHFFEHDIQYIFIGNIEIINIKFFDKRMALYESNKKRTVAHGNGFKINQIKTLKIKTYSILSQINKHFYLKLRIPIMQRHFFRKLPQNPEKIETHCNERSHPFHLACRKWYLYNSPQGWYSIITKNVFIWIHLFKYE